MQYPTAYDSLNQPSPSTVRNATTGISPAITVQELIKINQLLEVKVGLNTSYSVTADASTNAFSRSNHGLSNGNIIRMSSTGTLPGGVSANLNYYVVNSATNTFQIALTSGGAAIDLTSAGSGTHSYVLLWAAGKALVATTAGATEYSVSLPTSSVVGVSDVQTLSNKTLTTPTIGSFVNAQHDHEDAAGGGRLGVAALTDAAQQSLVPTGAILDFGGTSAPNGWLLCHGQAVSRTDYAALFAVIGTTFGAGDGSTTFNVPDVRGRVIAGQDDMGGTSANRLTGLTGGVNGDVLGASGGEEAHVLLTAGLPAHTHGITAADVFNTGAFVINDNSGDNIVSSDNIGAGTGTVRTGRYATQSTGSGTAHNNVQPTLIANKIIKI